MGLRSRIKNRVKSLLGEEAAAPAPQAAPPQPAPAQPAPAQPAPAQPAPTQPVAKDKLAAKARPAPAAAPKKIDEDKKRKARLKAKKAVLQFLIKQGGQAGMAEMHDFSERRYFVAHKAFSDLMEEFIEEELIDFDQSSYQATITEDGRSWVDAATHIKTREKM